MFVGGCTLEATEAVCTWAGGLAVEVLDGLASLLDKSLLQQAAREQDDYATARTCFEESLTLQLRMDDAG